MAISKFPSLAIPKDGVEDELLAFVNLMLTTLANNTTWATAVGSSRISELQMFTNKFNSAKDIVATTTADYNDAKTALEETKTLLSGKKDDMVDAREGMYNAARHALSSLTVDPAKLLLISQDFGWIGGQYEFTEPNEPLIQEVTMIGSGSQARLYINWKAPVETAGSDQPSLYYIVIDNQIIHATPNTDVYLNIAGKVAQGGQHTLTIRAQNAAGVNDSSPTMFNY
jgi:hypothetical protein